MWLTHNTMHKSNVEMKVCSSFPVLRWYKCIILDLSLLSPQLMQLLMLTEYENKKPIVTNRYRILLWSFPHISRITGYKTMRSKTHKK